MPENRVHPARNDFKTASLMAKYPFQIVKDVGPWSVWRGLLGYKTLSNDKRLVDFSINKLIEFHRKRDEAWAFLRALSDSFRKIDTTVLKDDEIKERIDRIFDHFNNLHNV